jgi:3-oxoacyl-[acyl-carrier protein] reductase
MHQFDLKNRTAIITGGAQGLGLEIAKRFIESGSEVIIWDIDKETINKAKQKLNSNKLTSQIVDVTNFENVNKIIEEITINKNVDIFVNNAGITGLTTKLWNYPIDEWHKVLNVNLNGTFYCCKAIVPHMIKNNYGRIVNVASVAGKDGNANASAYSAAKAAVIGLTKSLGKELAIKNIAVNVVTPSTAKTRILDQMSKDHVKFMFSKVPRKRFLEMNEFASLVTWLSSEENSFSTAAVFDISGGRSTY